MDDVQGQEFRALIVSTVRTCTKDPPPEDDVGFLTDPKVYSISHLHPCMYAILRRYIANLFVQLLNTAITRAKEWLVVIGDPVTLCTVGSNRVCWWEFVKHCCQFGSFEYPLVDPATFEASLENKLILRCSSYTVLLVSYIACSLYSCYSSKYYYNNIVSLNV